MAESLSILFEDNHCLVINKPAPLLTQAPPGIESAEMLAKAYLKERCQKAGRVYLGVPHRLDRPVTGVLLLARSTKAAQRLAEQFENKQVAKTYWGAVEGAVSPETGVWEDWLRKVPNEACAEVTPADAPDARLASLSYRVLQHAAERTLLEFIPQTGRMHQIRVQAAQRGWPVCGDVLYGARQPFGPAVSLPRDQVIALHARSLTFLHPIRYEPVTVTAPLPDSWRSLGFDLPTP